jgi:hypothetical protein
MTPAQAYLLAALPATDAELLSDCRTASRNSLCIGLPLTDTELRRMMAGLQLLGHCERRADGWFRTTPKPTEPKQKELF